MFFIEQALSEDEVRSVLKKVITDPQNLPFKERIIDPIITALENPQKRNKYIQYGNEFLDVNAEMLSKEFPTTRVTFPRRYVDDVLEIFGFTVTSLKETMKELLKQLRDNGNWKTLLSSPTNIVHAVALFYSDIILHRVLRDSARQQLGLTEYSLLFNKYYRSALPNVQVMTYTYMHLNNTWGLVKAENVITWIGNQVDTCYAFWKSQLSVDMNIDVLTEFLSRLRTAFNQSMQVLCNKYHENLDNGNLIGADTDESSDYIETKSFKNIRNNLIRMIKGGDSLYRKNGPLYEGISNLKTVNRDQLFELAQRVDYDDMTNIIDTIFYVFLVRPDPVTNQVHTVEEINTSVFIGKITNLPTQIDRAVPGMPIIIPMQKKYDVKDTMVKAYICLMAAYINRRIDKASET